MNSPSASASATASAESNLELESFREQWRAEVRARHPGPAQQQQQQQQQQQEQQQQPQSQPAQHTPVGTRRANHQQQPQHGAPTGSSLLTGSSGFAPTHGPPRQPPPARKLGARDIDDDYLQPRSFDEPEGHHGHGKGGSIVERGASKADAEPVTALEHYEKAVEREAAGSLGDSLRLYRKAFRMDDRVDQKYKAKHFPKPPPKSAAAPSSSGKHVAPVTKPEQAQPWRDLIASFSQLAIQPAPPEVEGMPQPPCHLAALPEEILVHILRDVAVLDVGDFVRLSQVCKRLAYLVATEDRIWRRVCLGHEFGFGGMHHHWQQQINWSPLTEDEILREAAVKQKQGLAQDEDDDDEELPPLTLEQLVENYAAEKTANTLALYRTVYGSSWLRMFRQRPRIRFNGCYISTVNYIRAGQANTTQFTWNSPVHIVTYYRYLRFFRDGTALSLLTVSEPADVVHHLTLGAFAQHAGGAAPHLPSAVVCAALRGRWRLALPCRADEISGDTAEGSAGHVRSGSAGAGGTGEVVEEEGDLIVETEGVSKYIYRLDLAMRTAGKGAGNNKLAWRGFYSYNPLTDDWGTFTMRNINPFFFSRVRSYGVMGA